MNFTLLNKTICLSAKRNSGKSELLKYLVRSYHSSFNKIFVISPTEEINHFYKDIVPSNSIFSEYDEDWVEELIKKMTTINSGKTEKEKKHILLILDDCCSDTNFHSSNSFKKLFTRGRHLCISIILTTQYIKHIPPIARSNCDYLLVGQLNNQNIELLADEYLMGNIDKPTFIETYHRCTKDYNFLIINCNSVKDDSDLNSIYGSIKTPDEELTNK